MPDSSGNTAAERIDNLICEDYKPISPDDDLQRIVKYFEKHQELASLPVVSQNRLLGTIRSSDLLNQCLSPDNQGLTAKHLLALKVQTVQSGSSLQEICHLMQTGEIPVDAGFLCVIHQDGSYKGLVTVSKLLIHLAQLRLNFTRYTNPLSRLPGSVHVDETIDRLMNEDRLFVAVHCDINDFRAFNSVYGYEQGDEVILFIAGLLQEVIDPEVDFVAHTGGDDFTVVFQSPDWFKRCEAIEKRIAQKAPDFYAEEHRYQQGIYTFNRMGERIFSPFFTLALGAVQVEPGKFTSHHEVISTALEVKQRAKSTGGGAIFFDERGYSCPENNIPLLRN